MKKNNSAKRGLQDFNQQPAQPDKIGWIRKYCGKGLFRDIWKSRYIVLKGEKLFISEKEVSLVMVKDEKKIHEVVDLTDYEKSEELRKAKSRTKKNHSKFTLLCSQQPGNTVPNLVFLAVSPEEKESWINALNIAITRAKNRILDEVTVEEVSCLAHPTRDRAKIPHTRRLPTRGHLLAVASTCTSDGMLTLDLIQEEDALASDEQETCEKNFLCKQDKSVSPLTLSPGAENCKFSHGAEASGKSQSLPRKSESSWDCADIQGRVATKKLIVTEKCRCVSMDEILSHSEVQATRAVILHSPLPASAQSVERLQYLITQKLERTHELLSEVRAQGCVGNCSLAKNQSVEEQRVEAERLLEEASSVWGHARDVLGEVKELRALCRQLDSACSTGLASSISNKLKNPQHTSYRKSMM
ncbi:pleckstrin homology domain-containing family O member 1b isoform X1 [Electrophorus electricus]|uniref:pleckstrin homology domain-containing family O member 1b isoform X1 n=1 Tax=Electrophorus electricus TaxID=8005 RepID=UPI0015D0832F|nr:pleckstrin homology domain-containing family O member 1b isoform X1 [Electrophorus electricus]